MTTVLTTDALYSKSSKIIFFFKNEPKFKSLFTK